MTQQNVKALLISVGGSPDPVVFSINRLRPECLCFFASEETKNIIDVGIIPKMEQPPKRWDQIITPNAEDLLKCCQALLKDLPGLLHRWGVEPSELTVDYTGGTKTMSAALALCTIDRASSFHYVGGKERSKGGVGIVVGGQEEAIYQVNPWDELAVRERKEAGIVFNRARYRQAADLFEKIEKRVSGGMKPFYKALADLSEGYALWDAFDHKGAWNKLQAAKKALEMTVLFGGPTEIKSLVATLKENLLFLEKIAMGAKEVKRELFFDLLANAERRAQLEQKYEDATARLYRALEVLAQARLSERGLITSHVDPARLPESLREEYIRRYTSRIDGKIKIGMDASYRLLKELNDDLGEAYHRNWESLRILLDARNSSYLAHGFVAIGSERYQRLLEMILKLSNTTADRLPLFPKME